MQCSKGSHIIWYDYDTFVDDFADNACNTQEIPRHVNIDRKWQDYVYIQCEYKSTKQKIKHLLREENKVKENKIS